MYKIPNKVAWMRVKRRGKKYSIWAVTLVGAIALLSALTTSLAVASPDPEITVAYQLEDRRVEELKAVGKYNEAIGLAQRALALHLLLIEPRRSGSIV